MNAKLGTINTFLARAVFVTSVVFSLSVTVLAAMTGETVLLMATAFGIATAAYSVQVLQPSSVGNTFAIRTEPLADAA